MNYERLGKFLFSDKVVFSHQSSRGGSRSIGGGGGGMETDITAGLHALQLAVFF